MLNHTKLNGRNNCVLIRLVKATPLLSKLTQLCHALPSAEKTPAVIPRFADFLGKHALDFNNVIDLLFLAFFRTAFPFGSFRGNRLIRLRAFRQLRNRRRQTPLAIHDESADRMMTTYIVTTTK